MNEDSSTLITAERRACEKAFEAAPNTTLAWCCHHDLQIEQLTEPPMRRIEYIQKHKPKLEQAARFRSFRPVRIALPASIISLISLINEASATDAAYSLSKKLTEDCFTQVKLNNTDFNSYSRGIRHSSPSVTLDGFKAKKEEAEKLFNMWTATQLDTLNKAVECSLSQRSLNIQLSALSADLVKLHNLDWPDNMWNNGKVIGTGCRLQGIGT